MKSDYNGGLTREKFLFYEIRIVASLYQLPNITYHNTYTGEKYESWGGYIEAAVSEFYERPYHYQAGWAEEPGGALKYQYGDNITKSEHMDLYSVWEQSRISNIPPVNRFLEHYDNHFMFGGRYWRKIGAGNDKALLIYDGSMELGGFEPNGTIGTTVFRALNRRLSAALIRGRLFINPFSSRPFKEKSFSFSACPKHGHIFPIIMTESFPDYIQTGGFCGMERIV